MNRISIALCTWNGEIYLEAQLRSILGQTRLPDELVIGDDASTDGCVDLAQKILKTAPFAVTILRHHKNLGSTANFQTVIEACTGDIIFPCDQDDVWLPNKIETCYNHLEQSKCSWLFHDATLIDATGIPLGKTHWEKLGIHSSNSAPVGLPMLLKRPYATGCCMAIRRSALSHSIPFGKFWVHDEWIASVLAAHGLEGKPLPLPLVEYRIHSNQQVGTRASGFWGRYRRIMAANSHAYAQEAVKNLELENALLKVGAPCKAVTLVAEKRRHYESRSFSSNSIGMNIQSILRELISGRYARYSWGKFAPLKDIIRILTPRIAKHDLS